MLTEFSDNNLHQLGRLFELITREKGTGKTTEHTRTHTEHQVLIQTIELEETKKRSDELTHEYK